MEIPVLIETLPDGKGYRAKAGEPFSVHAESIDRTGAIDEVRKKLDELIVAGQVVPVRVGGNKPSANQIGPIDMRDPEMQKWWQYVQDFRKECDSVIYPGEKSPDQE